MAKRPLPRWAACPAALSLLVSACGADAQTMPLTVAARNATRARSGGTCRC